MFIATSTAGGIPEQAFDGGEQAATLLTPAALAGIIDIRAEEGSG
jgi:hypothetical protein